MKENLYDPELRWKKTLEYESDKGATCTQFARPQNNKSDSMLYRTDALLKNIELETLEKFYDNYE